MAGCLITTTGTTGGVKIRYKLDGIAAEITASTGSDVYIPSTASEVTYEPLGGNAVASSSCASIGLMTSACFILSWETIFPNASGYVFDQITIGSTVLAISPGVSADSRGWKNLANALIALNSPILEVRGGKTDQLAGRGTNLLNVIVRVLGGGGVPEVRLRNTTIGATMSITGVISSNCLPTGYTQFPVC